jgi:hypothetical protein
MDEKSTKWVLGFLSFPFSHPVVLVPFTRPGVLEGPLSPEGIKKK